jgi:hypothetical protein
VLPSFKPSCCPALPCHRHPPPPDGRQARTPLVAMVDVDLIVSNALLQWLLSPKK